MIPQSEGSANDTCTQQGGGIRSGKVFLAHDGVCPKREGLLTHNGLAAKMERRLPHTMKQGISPPKQANGPQTCRPNEMPSHRLVRRHFFAPTNRKLHTDATPSTRREPSLPKPTETPKPPTNRQPANGANQPKHLSPQIDRHSPPTPARTYRATTAPRKQRNKMYTGVRKNVLFRC